MGLAQVLAHQLPDGARAEMVNSNLSRLQGPASPEAPAEAEPPLLDPVRTLTDVKLRSTESDSHSGHSGFTPSEYADMDILFSKACPQS